MKKEFVLNELIPRFFEINSVEKILQEDLKQKNFQTDIYAIAIGKAAWGMMKSLVDFYQERFVKGKLLTKYNHCNGAISQVEIFEAGHPYLDDNGIVATNKILEFIKSIPSTAQLIFLISGGTSALFEKIPQGISLDEYRNLQKELMKSGANIHELNAVRKSISSVKGGKLRKYLPNIKNCFVYLLSDVIGDDISVIGSGLLFKDDKKHCSLHSILNKYNIEGSTQLKKYLSNTKQSYSGRNPDFKIISNNLTFCNNIKMFLEGIGFVTKIITSSLNKEVELVSNYIFNEVKKYLNIAQKAALIFGGEPVVNVQGDGTGGPAQELALRVMLKLKYFENIEILSFSTDGTDGPTNYAGGFINKRAFELLGNNYNRILQLLKNNDSTRALNILDSQIQLKNTITNVNDICIVFINS